MPDATFPTSNEILQDLLQSHGYKATISGERVLVKGHEAQMSSEVFERPVANPFSVQLDVLVHLPDGRTLIESFAGVGDSLPAAILDGVEGFSRSSFHVLLLAFFGSSQGVDPHSHGLNEEMSEQWRLPTGHFTAHIGDVTFRGAPPVGGEGLVSWYEPFAHFIQQTPLPPHQSHWIRLYYGQFQGETMASEVLLNNEIWPELQQEMAAFPWPQGETFYSARLFLVLQPASG